MWPVVASLLCADPFWSESLGDRRATAASVLRPSRLQIREAFEDFDRSVKLWERERRELLGDQVIDQQRLLQRRRDEAPLSEQALKKYKVIEVGKGNPRGRARSKAKVIELPERDKVELQMDELNAEIAARRELCAKDPARCEREKKQREAIEKGNEAWDEAVTVNYEKRRSAIEAEARKFQDELNAARRRQEQQQAEKLGGAIDSEGNFVDSDLKELPQKPQ